MLKQTTKIFFVSIAFVFGLALNAFAADLYLVRQTNSFGIGQSFNVDVKINTQDQNINASQATLFFPPHILEVVSIEKSGSIFNFWVEEPSFSNDTGKVRFIGGTAKGVSGDALQVLKVRFKTKGVGTADISATEAVITASDGQGTNVLAKIAGSKVVVGTRQVQPTAPTQTEKVEPPVQALPIIQPKKVVRTPQRSDNLPKKPNLHVALYPDQNEWYSQLGEVIVLWDLPPDIIQVETKLDKSASVDSGQREAELYTGKNFGTLEEGVWFVRVRFRNNIGWGEFSHYKIQIDTTPPLPFEIDMANILTDNPTPQIRFETRDSLSGISHAEIFIDNGEGSEFIPDVDDDLETHLSYVRPGLHRVFVKVFDKAGNSVEDEQEFEIIPLPTPLVSFVTERVSQGERIFASGTSIPNSFIFVALQNISAKTVYENEVETDSVGNWDVTIDRTFDKGRYALFAVARDSRGAISNASLPAELSVKPRVILSLGFVDLSWFEIFLILSFATIAILSLIALANVMAQKKRFAYKTVAVRDVEKMSTLLSGNLSALEGWIKKKKSAFTPRQKGEIKYFIDQMKDNISKMKKYIGKEIGKLK